MTWLQFWQSHSEFGQCVRLSLAPVVNTRANRFKGEFLWLIVSGALVHDWLSLLLFTCGKQNLIVIGMCGIAFLTPYQPKLRRI